MGFELGCPWCARNVWTGSSAVATQLNVGYLADAFYGELQAAVRGALDRRQYEEMVDSVREDASARRIQRWLRRRIAARRRAAAAAAAAARAAARAAAEAAERGLPPPTPAQPPPRVDPPPPPKPSPPTGPPPSPADGFQVIEVQLVRAALPGVFETRVSRLGGTKRIPAAGIGIRLAPEPGLAVATDSRSSSAAGGGGWLVIEAMAEGGAASRSGKLRAGDRLVGVDGKTLEGVPADAVRARLAAGGPGTTVTLTVHRADESAAVAAAEAAAAEAAAAAAAAAAVPPPPYRPEDAVPVMIVGIRRAKVAVGGCELLLGAGGARLTARMRVRVVLTGVPLSHPLQGTHALVNAGPLPSESDRDAEWVVTIDEDPPLEVRLMARPLSLACRCSHPPNVPFPLRFC